MKKILLIVLFLQIFHQKIVAQTIPVGRYEVYFEGWLYGANNHHCGEANVEFNLSKNSINRTEQFFHATYGENSPTQNFARLSQGGVQGTLKYFNADETINSIRFSASRRIRSSCNGHRPHNIGTTSSNLNTTCYSLDFSFAQFTNEAYDDGGLWNSDFTLYIRPELVILDPTPTANFLATDHKISINSHTDFRPQEYRWQYKTNNGLIYNPLSQFDGQSSIDVSATDILGSNVNNYIGQTIFIRQSGGCNTYSNIVQYRVLKSAPKVINHGPSIKTSCYDSNDGQYRLYFDRPLDSSANEYISIGVVNTTTLQPAPVDYTNITQLDTDNSFNLTGLAAGGYELKIIGKYNGTDTFSETTATPIIFTIEKNAAVDFSITKRDVWCYQGTDGVINITASGGTLNDYEYQINDGAWIPFTNPSSFTQTIAGLTEGIYTVKVRDGNECVAKIQVIDAEGNIGLGVEKELSLTLTAPQKPLTIDYTLIQEPTYNGATNGKLVAKIDGGTIFDNNTYWYEWKNSQGQVIPETTQFTSGSFYITLDGIPADTYYLTVRDKNYNSATDKVNCTIVEYEKELTQPNPLTAVIELVKPISCYNANEFGDATDANPQDGQWDESQDGILKVVVTGGKPFTGTQNGGRPYKYTWKKQNTSGVWEVMPNVEAGKTGQIDHHFPE